MTALPEILKSPPHNSRAWIGAVILATLVVYLRSFGSGWVWDDNHYVTDNIQLRTLHGLREIWLRPEAEPQYYPLTHTTFWIEYHLWGVHPFGYHLDNILLHIANAVMIGLILCRLDVPGYAWAAAIFALHPVHVESVAWVTERKNVLSGLLYLLALWIALDVWRIAPGKRRLIGEYFICLTLFILSLLSKSVTASFPAIILLLLWCKQGRFTWRQFASLLPFFGAGMAMGSMTAWMEKHVVGAIGPDWNWTVAQRTLIAGRAVWFYLGKLIRPYPLIFIYPKWQVDAASWQWIYPATLLALLAILFALRDRIGRGPLTAILFCIISLTPALGFVDVYPMRYSFVADHFQYLASIGPIALLASILWRRKIIPAAILLILSILTWRQQAAYRNVDSLWSDVISKDAGSVVGHTDLGMAFLNQGELDLAEAQLRKAAQTDPDFIEAQVGLGMVAQAKGADSQAMEIYRAALTYEPANPLPWWQMALLDRLGGNIDAAKNEFAKAAEFLPNPAPAYEQLGEIELSQNHFSGAQEQFKRALAADPDRVDAHNNLASDNLALGDFAAAQAQCEAALKIDPQNAEVYNNLGVALARQGKPEAAAAAFQTALRINPNFAMAGENLRKLGR